MRPLRVRALVLGFATLLLVSSLSYITLSVDLHQRLAALRFNVRFGNVAIVTFATCVPKCVPNCMPSYNGPVTKDAYVVWVFTTTARGPHALRTGKPVLRLPFRC